MAANSELLADVFTGLYEQNSADNDLFTPTMVKTALNDGFIWVAEQACLYPRSHQMNAVDEQANYTLPADMFDIEDVYWYTTTAPLTRFTKTDLRLKQSAAWRSASSGTPSKYYKEGNRTIGLYPKPNVDASEYFTIHGWCIPYSVGTSLASITRVTTTITVTTAAAHGLRVGESVTASGTGTTEFNAAHTVVTVPSTTTFTATVTAVGANTGAAGYLYYTGGLLPLIADADVPQFYAGCHDILTQYAILRFATGVLAHKPQSPAVAQVAAGMVQDYLGRLKHSVYR